MLALKRQGLTYAQIAAEGGVSRQRVQQLLRGRHHNGDTGGTCKNCGLVAETGMHTHHVDWEYPEITHTLCVSCHTKETMGPSRRPLCQTCGMGLGYSNKGSFCKAHTSLPPIKHGTVHGFQGRKCRCTPCMDAYREYWQANRAAMKLKPPPIHGTHSSYSNYGCRCQLCTEAGTAKNKEYLKRIPLDQRKKRGPTSHGTPSGYRYHKCRCRPCTDANTAQAKKYL